MPPRQADPGEGHIQNAEAGEEWRQHGRPAPVALSEAGTP